MKRIFFLLAFLVAGLLLIGTTNKDRVPSYLKDYQKEYRSDPKAANLHWFKDAQYGMFIHYGLYSLLEKGE